ncbi:FAD-dependent monooxygenase [Salinispora arenicola]|uniref:FAD-dependent oxidoreductase n=1 Tax=Salinispora arenicola TaxID=168697 RepID=A0A542XV87_SALAC|nr:FAD-dependent monooxygenase [Salinispora arenicola]TQL39613.1 2-polyprenyl-6-methoxyphenol hydroxylase-like FAD-dependent oxidoreductase [Salinispora arenicola]GIM81433.1 FAD-dependent oxidoreductase [Salinispora arenicola]
MTSPLTGLRILISGAGVTGPALAYWLSRSGAETTVVEIAPTLRASGFAVDFRGPTHLGVLERMGLIDDLRAIQTHSGALRCVDELGRTIFELPTEIAGGDIEVNRRDLSRALYELSAPHAEYLFGEAITALSELGDGVHVEFVNGKARTFDLVIGADGLHSRVRRLAFGPEQRYVRHLGYYLGGWSLPNDLGADITPQQYNVPGRMASVAADQRDPSRADAFVVFASPQLRYDWRNLNQQKTLITNAFTGLGWHVPLLLDSLNQASELYFDSISRVTATRWVTGRTALLGDAAWGLTLGGMGVGTGIVGAYVLAGELAAARGEYHTAFAAYQRRMRPYAARWQRGTNPGRLLAPSTAWGLRTRNSLFATRLVQKLLVMTTKTLATRQSLPAYAAV